MSEFKEIDDYQENITYNEDDDFDLWNIHSLLNHIQSNKLGFLLLLFVFVIIYIIDYINRINSSIFGISNPMPMPGMQNTLPMQLPKMVKRKQKK